jgi:hypothetical protein
LAFTTFQPPHYFCFCEIIVTFFLFQQYLCYSSWGLLKPLIKFNGLIKTQISQIKVTESVINSKTSSHRSNTPSLGTILPKYWTIMSSRLSEAGLKESYCMFFSS